MALVALGLPATALAESNGAASDTSSAADVSAAAAPSNDDFADAATLTGARGTLPGTTVGATRERNEPDHGTASGTSAIRTTWFRWIAPSATPVTFDTFGTAQLDDTTLAVYTGSAVGALTLIDQSDDDISGSVASSVTFTPVAGTEYRIAVSGYGGRELTLFRLSWRQEDVASVNDSFAEAIPLQDLALRVGGNNTAATHETDEVDHASSDTEASVWYRWTAPTDTTMELLVEASFSRVIAVYTGTEVDDLTTVDSIAGDSLLFAVDEGTTYSIAIDGDSGSNGTFALGLSPFPPSPPNDDFADAEVITGATGTTVGLTAEATTEVDEPEHGASGLHTTIWYEWTAPASGPVTFALDDPEPFEVWLAVYTGSALADLAPVNQTRIAVAARFDATQGTTYSIAIDADDPTLASLRWGPSTQTFPDVSVSSPFWREIEWMNDRGITTGNADGTFKPSAAVSRQAMSAFLFRSAGGFLEELPNEATFSDVPFDRVFFYEIDWMNQEGISTGYEDNTFRPTAPVTRQAMSAFLFRFADVDYTPGSPTFSDVGVSHPFYEEIEWMNSTGITTGYQDNTFRPSAPVTRQAMSAFIYRYDQGIT